RLCQFKGSFHSSSQPLPEDHRMKRRKNLEPNAPPIGDRLLTLREAAEVLRLSTRTLREDCLVWSDHPVAVVFHWNVRMESSPHNWPVPCCLRIVMDHPGTLRSLTP